ncbi:hypothetical protein ACHAWF_018104 [Thalassiosira exigua]
MVDVDAGNLMGVSDDGSNEGGRNGDLNVITTSTTAHEAAQIPPSSVPQKRAHKKRKASKGRLKKLWRRATGPPPGITSRGEWTELEEMHSDWKSSVAKRSDDLGAGGGVATDREALLGPLPGPSVLLASQQQRDFHKVENWQVTEGFDHRDVLMNLLFGGQSQNDVDGDAPSQGKNKRIKMNATVVQPCRPESATPVDIPPMPSWSKISNLSSVGGVAVIEVDIAGGESDAACPIMPSQRMQDSKSSNIWQSLLPRGCDGTDERVQRTMGAACKVKLFQGSKQPRCSSDVLMFLPPPVEARGTQQNTCVNFHRALNNLLLKPKQLMSEGYPIEANAAPTNTGSSKTSDVARERLGHMLGASAEIRTTASEALDLVRALSVDFVWGNEEDDGNQKDDYSEYEHHIKTFPHHTVANGIDGETKRPQRIFALDCEMVKTASGPELARVSIIMYAGGNGESDKDNNTGDNGDEKSTVVLDELVKPRRKVSDYLTEYSGITQKMLEHVETRIEQVQIRCLSLIDENDIIIGHSLENDMRALRLIHSKIIDTSVVFRGTNGRKFSLRHLSNVLLQRKIQQGSLGHCSTEDAEAALVLALRRARRGNSFNLKGNPKRQNIISVFQTVNREAKGDCCDANSFAERKESSCVCIGPNDWISKYANDGAQHVLSCDSIADSMAMAVPSWLSSDRASKRAGFLWANLRCGDPNRIVHWENEAKRLDEILKATIDRVPYEIPILVVFQQNYEKALALTQQRKAARNPKASSGWTSQQEEEWERYLEQSRVAEAVWIGTACPSTCS